MLTEDVIHFKLCNWNSTASLSDWLSVEWTVSENLSNIITVLPDKG